MEDGLFVAYRSAIKKRLREQIARTRSVNPQASTQQTKKIQLAQEIERINGIDDCDVRAGLIEYVQDLFRKLDALLQIKLRHYPRQ